MTTVTREKRFTVEVMTSMCMCEGSGMPFIGKLQFDISNKQRLTDLIGLI